MISLIAQGQSDTISAEEIPNTRNRQSLLALKALIESRLSKLGSLGDDSQVSGSTPTPEVPAAAEPQLEPVDEKVENGIDEDTEMEL